MSLRNAAMNSINEINDQRVFRGKAVYLSTLAKRWRRLHLITLVVAFFSAFTVCFTFVVYDNQFSPHCPLYGRLHIRKVRNKNDTSLVYQIVEKGAYKKLTRWGPSIACSAVLYTSLMDMLAAVSWILFFSIKGGFSPNFQRKLVPSTCICAFFVTITSFASAVVITRGGNTFCESFKGTELEKCPTAQFVRWKNYPKMHGFYDYLVRCQVASWVTTHTWIFHFVMSLIQFTVNADNVIAEELELKEKGFDVFAMIPPLLLRERSTENIEDDFEDEGKTE